MSEVQNQEDNLLTAKTSPAVIQKTFVRLGKLLDILSGDMAKPLPPKAKFELLDEEGFKLLGTKLVNTTTKYVLFVCQQGTMKTIESQTSILLEDVRKMCTSLRGMLPGANPTFKNMIVNMGKKVLSELKDLTADISKQISAQYKVRHANNNTTMGDLNVLESNTSISRITARIWETCDRLSHFPTSNQSAVAKVILQQCDIVFDAHRELSEIVEGDHELPEGEEEEEEEAPELIGLTEEERELMALENELNDFKVTMTVQEPKKENEEKKETGDHEDDVYDDKNLSKSEFKWIASALSLAKVTTAIFSKFQSILPSMKSPYRTSDGVINLAIVGEVDVIKVEADFYTSLEDRRNDAEYIADHMDKMCNALYTPQELSSAARSAYFVVSRLSKMLLWLQCYDQSGWLSEYHKDQNTVRLTADAIEAISTSTEHDFVGQDGVPSLAGKNWFTSRIINATLPLVKGIQAGIDGEENDEQAFYNDDAPVDTLRRRNEFTVKNPISSISTFPLINRMREELFKTLTLNIDCNVINYHLILNSSDELVDDSDDDDGEMYVYDEDYEDEDEFGYDDFDDNNIIFY